jgi:hypothetical protein
MCTQCRLLSAALVDLRSGHAIGLPGVPITLQVGGDGAIHEGALVQVLRRSDEIVLSSEEQ